MHLSSWMPCPCCKLDLELTEWKSDPLRWDLDPPCSEAEWNYLRELHGAPECMETTQCSYMNKICRGCFNTRFGIMARVQSKIRSKGGLHMLQPTERMKKEYEEAHAHDLLIKRAAKIHGLQSVAAAGLNGQVCRLLSKDLDSGRWTVELVDGEQKSIKEDNLSASKDIDLEWEIQQIEHLKLNPDPKDKNNECTASVRPLGSATQWPKVKGIHPGAVVKIKGLTGAVELNGRTARCISFNAETGRWKIDLGDDFKSLKTYNLIPSPTDKSPTKDSALAEKKAQQASSINVIPDAREVYAQDYGWDG